MRSSSAFQHHTAMDHNYSPLRIRLFRLFYGRLATPTNPRRPWSWDGYCTRAIYILMPRRMLLARLFRALTELDRLRDENFCLRHGRRHPDS